MFTRNFICLLVLTSIAFQLPAQSGTDCIDFNSSRLLNNLNEWITKSGSKIILTGESHGVSATYPVFFKLIQSINAENNFQNILCERSYAEAHLYNKYLETKNEDYLKYDVAWSADMRGFFNSIYEFNAALPVEKKLRFIGIDAIHSDDAFVLGIQSLLPTAPPPNSIAGFIDSLKKVTFPVKRISKNYFNHLDFLRDSFKGEIEKNYAAYETYFGDEFKHIKSILNSKSSYSKPGNRNGEMYNNLIEIANTQNIKTSFIGLFGISHVMKLKSISKSFAGLANESAKSPYANKVGRLLIHYENCMANFQGKDVKVTSLLNQILGKEEKEFKAKFISGSDCDNLLVKIPSENKKLIEHCNYIVFVSNSPAVRKVD